MDSCNSSSVSRSLRRSPRSLRSRPVGFGLLAALLLPLLRAPSPAVAGDLSGTDHELTAFETDRHARIQKGCAWLASQRKRDGSFGVDSATVAITALSVLALMAEGSSDGRGTYGTHVRDGIDFLLRLVEQPQAAGRFHPGYFYYSQDYNSRMHGQGYATLALATAIGTGDMPGAAGKRAGRIRAVLQKAVECIEQAQTDTGGFGYDPVPNKDHEGSVTVTIAQGLRAARDVGIAVDANVVKHGLYYLKRSQKEPGDEYDGSFRYSLHQERTSYALTAAALSSFFLYGAYDDDSDRTIERGMRFLLGPKGLEAEIADPEWWYYGHFYAAWATWQKDGDRSGDEGNSTWGRWHRTVYPRLLEMQSDSGAWEDDNDRFDLGRELPTAFAILTLAIPDETIPIFQR